MTNRLERIYSLDVLRGFASLAVVFNHWKYFANNLPPVLEVDRSSSPLYIFAKPFYESGWIAVDLFFCISGFIFAYYYSAAIRQRQLGWYEFFLRRISRLYPLFLVSTLFVAALQIYSWKSLGHSLVYENNDWAHFFLSAGLLSAWGFEVGPSFNGPSWSISIEMLLYVIFFFLSLMVRTRSQRILILVGFVFLGVIAQTFSSSYIGRGLMSFFIGWLVAEGLKGGGGRVGNSGWFLVLSLMWFLAFLEAYFNTVNWILLHIAKLLFAPEQAIVVALMGVRFLMVFVLFPITISSLVILEKRGSLDWTKRLVYLGELSFPIYLLHFPLQAIFILIASELGWLPGFENSYLFLIFFFLVLLCLSHISAYCFERPLQAFLRRKLSPR